VIRCDPPGWGDRAQVRGSLPLRSRLGPGGFLIVLSSALDDHRRNPSERRIAVRRMVVAGAAAAAVAVGGAIVVWAPWASSASSGYEPVLDPANFTTTITNPYFPLPVGRKIGRASCRERV